MFKSRIISLFLCLLFTVNFTYASALKLKGFIGAYPISMELDLEPFPQKEGDIVKGKYSYEKYKRPIELNGRIDSRRNLIINESAGTFQLEREWGCGLSELTGVWTNDKVKELPVKLSAFHEETDKISTSGVEYKIIKEIDSDAYGNIIASIFLLIAGQKVQIDARCDVDVGSADVSLIKVNNQQVYEVVWGVASVAMGSIDDGNIIYLHGNGDVIKGGVSGHKMGIEYSKNSCDISVLDDIITRVCVQESLSKDINVFVYDEAKKVELFYVGEKGFEVLAAVSTERGAEKKAERPFDLMNEVGLMSWTLISR